MGFLNAATTAVSTASNVLSSVGPAVGLGGLASSLGSTLSNLGSLLSGLGGGAGGLPLPNILSGYTTYNYVLSLGVLSDKEINYPDSTYLTGASPLLVCKSANAEPYNRVATAYGKFDFFLDNLVTKSVVGFEKSGNTNVMGIEFQITEPFSMGMFTVALQTGAFQVGWKNYREAPYLLKIEFRGNKSDGSMTAIPNTTRYIPIKILKLDMKVNEKGAIYNVRAIPFNHQALSTKNANFKSDVAIKGATVQELLQTGEKSLQAVINQRLQQLKTDGLVKAPDEVLILFPKETASAASAGSSANKESTGSATTSPSPTEYSSNQGIYTKLGVAKSKINKTLVQGDGDCNELGKASMGFGLDKKGDPTFGSETKVWDAKNKVWTRGSNTSNIKEGEFKFSQNTDIINAINQVLLNSNFPKETLDASKVTPEGMRGWWAIDTQVYMLASDENDSSTGESPKLIIYRVVPYAVSVDRTNPPNTAPPGVPNLKKQVVKEYNYLYTGKNTEIIKFDIEFKTSFSILMAADGLKRSQDVITGGNTGVSETKEAVIDPQPDGSAPPSVAGVTPTSVSYTLTTTSTDRRGGGGSETQATRAARVFHDAITRGTDMMRLNMEIWGDPYYIVQSGTGNYTSKNATQNLNADGTANYQNGELYITVNFRTPIDINQATGMYNFAGSSSAPVVQFSGLYRVFRITSTFAGGKFTQLLSGSRMLQQENPNVGTPSKTFSTSNAKPNEVDPYNYGDA
jgi:hypothetical protein